MVEGICGSFFLSLFLAGYFNSEQGDGSAKMYFKYFGIIFGGLFVACVFIFGLVELFKVLGI